MSRRLHAAWNRLEAEIARHERLLIAFSGGCDSAFLVAAARRVLGKENVLAVTAVSASLAESERRAAQAFAQTIDVRHEFLKTREFENSNYLANPPNRCFFCKDELFSQLIPLARSENRKLADGVNRSDRGDFRPGLVAAANHGVLHPLDEAGLEKADIRILSRWLRLPTWNKPATPCLSSRVPYGSPVSPSVLRQIEEAEKALIREGFAVVRVRHYGATARIEVPRKELPRLKEVARWERIERALRGCGFQTLEIEERGFRSGRLNESIAGNAG